MKQLFRIVITKMKKWYYFQELKEISFLCGILLTVWGIYGYGKATIGFIVTPTGIILLSFLMLSIVLALVIKIYYRMIVIKYHENDRNIQLLKKDRSAE